MQEDIVLINMIKILTTTFLLLLFASNAHSIHQVELFYENTDDGYLIYAKNEEYCPMSITVLFKLNNLVAESDGPFSFVVHARQEKQFITKLKIRNRTKSYGFNMDYSSYYGDFTDATYDQNYVYQLPFARGKRYEICQGYNGQFTHQGKNSLDFEMPIGTAVHAVRSGVVIHTEDRHSKGCPRKDCAQYNNTVIIYHADGTFAQYSHINQSGAVAKVGDEVEAGDLIAYSGNVGWTSGPHLHLTIFRQIMEKRETLQTPFQTAQSDGEYLEYRKTYSRPY